jgi:hypothetical protein
VRNDLQRLTNGDMGGPVKQPNRPLRSEVFYADWPYSEPCQDTQSNS